MWSLENFKRSIAEQEYLFSTLAGELAHTLKAELLDKNVRLRVIGDHARFPQQVRSIIADAEEKTAGGTQLTLNLLFCYGGQQEIVAAAQSLARAVQAGTLDPDAITAELFTEQLWSAKVSNPDIIIRTGKRQSLSNFYTYKSAYSEIHFLDCYWPDLTREHLMNAVNTFGVTQRKYGA